ncbi:MAG: 7TM-DISM domain-containing protein [Leptospira sp.]|nr:7TM-DISM domain-containing protein [Leptospira sp.]
MILEHFNKISKIFLCLLFIIFTVFMSCVPIDSNLPILVEGEMDLRDMDPSIEVIPLHGEWEFFPGIFISDSETFSNQEVRTLQKVPGNWSSVFPSGIGYGTYRARIRLPEAWNFPIAFKISDQGTAYRLLVNQVEVASNGVVGRNAQESKPHGIPTISPSLEVSGEMEILFHVSNFHFREGGLWYPILLGRKTGLYEIREKSLNLDIFLLGSISIMGVYHIILFFIRRRDFSPLWFSLFCFAIIFRLLSFNEKYIFNVIPSISFLWLTRMQYLSYFMSVPLFSQFLYSIYPGIYSLRMKQGIWILSGVFCSIVFFTDTGIFTHTSHYFHMVTILSSVYFLFIIVRAFLRKEKSATLLFLGTVVMLVGAVNDILYSMQIIYSNFVIPQALLFFIFLQSVILSIRFSGAIKDNEILSSKLQNINEDLEAKIQERTIQYKSLRNH